MLVRRILLFVLGIWLVLVPTSRAAPVWRWSNPGPFGGNIADLAYGLGLTVAVAERGQIYTSEDLYLWEPRVSGTERALRSVLFFGNRLIITGEAGIVLYADSLDQFHFLDLGTTDWLEGAAASSTLLVAVGDEGAIYTSSDGASWQRQATPFSTWLRGVAFGNGVFVAVGENGFIATSSNGTNWTTRTSGTTAHLNRVVRSEDRFLAAGDNGRLLQSAGGTNWNVLNTGATGSLYGAACLTTDWAAAGQAELRRRQANGIWTDELLVNPSLPRWTYTSVVAEEPLLLVGGRSGLMLHGVPTNGPSGFLWVPRSRPIRNWLWEIVRLPDFYITAGYNGTIMSSDNGLDWNLELVPSSATNTTFLGIGGTTNLLLAVGNGGQVLLSPNALTNVALTNLDGTLSTNQASTLGIVWHELVPRPTVRDLQGVAASDSLFVLTGSQGTILTSTNGTNWILGATPTQAFLSGVACFPGGWVATGDLGTILTSPNGSVWTQQSSGTTNWIYRVRWLGDRLVAVGENGTLLTSFEGEAWNHLPTGTSSWLNDALWVGGTYYLVGTQGTVLASTNTVDWTDLGIITGKSLYGAASFAGQLVVVGVEGAILRSQVQPLLDPAHFERYTILDNYDVYLISGKPDQRWTLEHAPGMGPWEDGADFEFLDSSGITLLLQPRITTPSQEFHRARLLLP